MAPEPDFPQFIKLSLKKSPQFLSRILKQPIAACSIINDFLLCSDGKRTGMNFKFESLQDTGLWSEPKSLDTFGGVRIPSGWGCFSAFFIVN